MVYMYMFQKLKSLDLCTNLWLRSFHFVSDVRYLCELDNFSVVYFSSLWLALNIAIIIQKELSATDITCVGAGTISMEYTV